MGIPTPTQDEVVAAVRDVIISGTTLTAANVLDGMHQFETDMEKLETFVDASGDGRFAMVIADPPDEIEGEASGEHYSIYNIRVRYYDVRTSDAEWDKKARAIVESMRDAINKASDIFARGGLRQVITPETAGVTEQGFVIEPDHRGEQQYVWRADVILQVEGRRYS